MQFAGHSSQSASKVEADTSIPKYQGHGAGPKMNGEHLQMRLALEEAHTRPLPGRTGRGRWKQTEGRKTETWRVKPRNTRLHSAEGLSGGGNFNLAAEDTNRHLLINRRTARDRLSERGRSFHGLLPLDWMPTVGTESASELSVRSLSSSGQERQ